MYWWWTELLIGRISSMTAVSGLLYSWCRDLPR